MHEPNHYHALVMELQQAKKRGMILEIKFLEHDLLIMMSSKIDSKKLQEVADHISNKYRILVDVAAPKKNLLIRDVYSLDPRV